MLRNLFLCLLLAIYATGAEHDVPSLRGKTAPEFTVQSLDGKIISLSNYKGKVLVINFWATWCEYCRLEMPWLAELREKYASQGFEVLGIVTDNAGKSKVSALTERLGVHYPILMCNHKTAQAYGGLPSLPVSFYIGRDGKVVEEIADASSKDKMEEVIKKMLAAQP